MTTWTVYIAVYNNQLEFQVILPDEWSEQTVYDFVLEDIEIDLVKEDS